ncbi:ABC transporter [Paenibacillus psychroresistens]|uniref:ABC transporter n=1 Tax=Paenibacillus psychroresistens TaxID=1778678 RepID=A0A6B8RG28_9BACL|nr:ABC transporter permease subunit [Paenibacillus psychroresistens]QGQ94462.1 ABC transporter [Paenibacillus psychroresistens]
MNLFWREIRAHRKALIIWCIGALILVAAGMNKFAVYSSSGQSMTEVISKMPKSLQVLLGMGPFDLATADGYYAFLFIYLVLMATIHAALIGSSVIAKEERDRTSEFLIVKPISRSTIITAKLLAALTNVLFINIITLISSIVFVNYFGKGVYQPSHIFILIAGMFILQLIFMLLGTGIGALSQKPKSAPSITVIVLFVTYLLSMIIDLNSKLDFLQYFTPFKYFEAKNLLIANSFSLVFVIISILIMAALLKLTYNGYQKRDFR